MNERLPSRDIQIQELGEERVAVTLGKAPAAGDREASHNLLLYRELAHVLEP